ncbi:molybdopterin molybdotransferase MoeA [Sphingomonas sanxanigenens]|uniref:Molybdopterin molybdenumtransferase n=1 Tax=Sphingomonas sanxanigenens DSM 19645 = NX02 TaxID=1123269 RepID=W0AIS3_9SPHN|nr:molybdopterin molybdotransferase MoeA [Sphingomonas sanxanigenens]AHE57001.1 hypothetical protein NX02_27075 [Sphingomonas sanxanigenens DSM 19645 = NX02]
MSLLPVSEAQARLFALAPPVAIESVAIDDAAGRWTAEPIVALRTQPWRDLSAMDGYALRFADLEDKLTVIGESAAGRPFDGDVGAGQAARIFTGAALPPGADTVLLQEEARREGDALWLDGEGPLRRGAHIRRAGSDFLTGDMLIEAGIRLGPAQLGLAAMGGHGRLPVRRRVRVAMVATGDELALPGAPLVEGVLPASNGPMLRGLLAGLPVEIVDLGILPDRLDVLADAFRAVEADILVTTGGASVGDHDLVRPALAAAGAEIDFWRIAMKPGKPLMAGRLGNTVALGLPGNPVSAFVTARLFLVPLVAALSGAAQPAPTPLPGVLGGDLAATANRAEYVRARIVDGRLVPSATQDSAAMRALARADALIFREAHAEPAKTGESCFFLPLA